MSHDNSDTTRTGTKSTLTTIIPEDTSTGVFEVKLGMTAAELALVAAPVVAEVWIILSFLDPARWQVFLVGGTAALMYGLVQRTADHLTPREQVARRVGSAWAQVRMPLVGESAAEVPGVEDVHPDADAAERRDGAQVALVGVQPGNASQLGDDAKAARALALANQLDASLSKKDTPAKVMLRRRHADTGEQVEELDDVAEDGLAFGLEERAFAIDRANEAVAEVASEGTMDLSVFVATWVHPNEVNADTRRLDELAGTRFVRPSDELREEQFDLLDRRVGNVLGACQSVASPRRLGSEAIVTALREYWLGVDVEGDLPETHPSDSGVFSGLSSAFAPGFVDAHSRYADLDEQTTSSFWVTGWPKYPNPGFLTPVLEAEGVECDISVFIGATDRRRKMDELGARMGKVADEGADDAESGDSAGADDAAAHETDLGTLRDHMRDDGVDASEVSLYVTLRAADTETLSEHRDDLEDAATEAGLSISLAGGRTRQMAGLVSTSPVGGDRLFEAMRGYLDKMAEKGGLVSELLGVRTGTRTRTEMPPGSVGAMLPFSGGVLQHHDGVLYGLATSTDGNALGMLQVARDRLTSPHRFFVGRSGSGKTFRVIVNLVEELIRHPGRRAVIIDIAENFDGVVKVFGGQKVKLGETTINPFSVAEGADLDRQITMLTTMFQIYLRHNTEEGVAESVRPELSEAIREAYRQRDIYGGSDAGKPSPTVADLHDALEHMHDNPGDFTVRDTETETEETKEHAGLLLARLKPFTEDGAYSHLVADPDHPDDAADLDARVVLFDMENYQNTEGAEKGMLTMLVLARTLGIASGTDAFVNVVCDEAHDLFDDAQQAGLFESTVRAGRNAGICFDFLSQAGEDFDEAAARIIAKQCSAELWGDLGEMDPETPLRFGWSHSQATTINGDLETGDNEATDYAEAMVNIEGDRYRTEFRVGPVAHAVASYRESRDGDWDPYIREAIQDAAEVEQEYRDADSPAETDVATRTGVVEG